MPVDDGYGRRWDYRVFSQQYTNPDDWNVGQRYLTVHQVAYVTWKDLLGSLAYPLPEDVLDIESEPASPEGVGIEEALLDAERIMQAFNKPVLIRAEFQKFFDHSERQHELQRRQEKRRKHGTAAT